MVYNNTNCTNLNDELSLLIYYKNKIASNLIIKNNMLSSPPPMQESLMIYECPCPLSHHNVISYIRFTQYSLNQRLSSHVQHDSVKDLFLEIRS